MLYFAYGSNMDEQEMKNWIGCSPQKRRGILRGYALKFNKKATGAKAKKGEGKGNIVEDENDVVEGMLYDISDSNLKKFDKKEGYPNHYNRITVNAELDDHTTVQAIAYTAQPNMTREGLRPTRKYLNHYLAACDILSEPYCQKLRSVETLD